MKLRKETKIEVAITQAHCLLQMSLVNNLGKIITSLHLTRGQLSKIDYILIITFVLSVIRSILVHGYKG